MPSNNVAIGVDHEFVELGNGLTEQRFHFVIRTEGPVRNWVRGIRKCPTRAAAMQDFQDFCEAMGWVNMATEVEVGTEEVEVHPGPGTQYDWQEDGYPEEM